MSESSITIRWDKNADGGTDISVSGEKEGQTHLLNNSGTEAYRKLAMQLRQEGVVEEQYIEMLDKRLINWRNDKDMSQRIEVLLKILFHTFF